mmetsp:Transcript_30834/g.71208  ORF Transcript_30834/g.71208 Transcript_30834/m.71208 type:complete len:271 (-) Transcript_30834:402-1214(-)
MFRLSMSRSTQNRMSRMSQMSRTYHHRGMTVTTAMMMMTTTPTTTTPVPQTSLAKAPSPARVAVEAPVAAHSAAKVSEGAISGAPSAPSGGSVPLGKGRTCPTRMGDRSWAAAPRFRLGPVRQQVQLRALRSSARRARLDWRRWRGEQVQRSRSSSSHRPSRQRAELQERCPCRRRRQEGSRDSWAQAPPRPHGPKSAKPFSSSLRRTGNATRSATWRQLLWQPSRRSRRRPHHLFDCKSAALPQGAWSLLRHLGRTTPSWPCAPLQPRS